MTNKKGFYGGLKSWFEQKMYIEQPKNKIELFEPQRTNLEPIFDSQTNQFTGVLYTDLDTCAQKDYLNYFSDALDTMAYWYCHGRAILTLLPLPVELLSNDLFSQSLEQKLIDSKLPVGYIKIPLTHYKTVDFHLYKEKLLQLERLGIILELKNFSGGMIEIQWLNTGMFTGVHFSTSLIRAASITTYSKEIINDLLITCKRKNYHLYSEGISLVHDFTFTKNSSIQYCYGPLMMPAVSKHQILKINQSQFTDALTHAPKKNSNDRE